MLYKNLKIAVVIVILILANISLFTLYKYTQVNEVSGII